VLSRYKKIDLKEVGKRIRELRGPQSQLAFARQLNVHQVDISRLERGETVNPSPELLLNICRLQEPAIDMEWLVSGEGQKLKDFIQEGEEVYNSQKPEKGEEFVYLPKVFNSLVGSHHQEALDPRAVVDHVAFKKKWIEESLHVKQEHLILIEAIGDSMVPTLYHGDLLLIDGSVNTVREDGIYCFCTPDKEVLVKRLQRIPSEGLAVKSDNPKYEQYIIPEDKKNDYLIIGPVVWVGRKF
jgi:phage repressor protein C with HTH and peptisase S24 domain